VLFVGYEGFGLLCVYIMQLGTLAPLVALVGLLLCSFAAEWGYRRRTDRTLQPSPAA
jgi:hypothetical protein